MPCVFNRDTHSKYHEALDIIEKLSQDNVSTLDSIEAIPSILCFEYWYLLHVKNTRLGFGMEGSPCVEVIKILKGFNEFYRYSKASCQCFCEKIQKNRKCYKILQNSHQGCRSNRGYVVSSCSCHPSISGR